MMSDIERAARALCISRGIDPDELVALASIIGTTTAEWQMAAREIHTFLEVRAALAAVETGGKSLY